MSICDHCHDSKMCPIGIRIISLIWCVYWYITTIFLTFMPTKKFALYCNLVETWNSRWSHLQMTFQWLQNALHTELKKRLDSTDRSKSSCSNRKWDEHGHQKHSFYLWLCQDMFEMSEHENTQTFKVYSLHIRKEAASCTPRYTYCYKGWNKV